MINAFNNVFETLISEKLFSDGFNGSLCTNQVGKHKKMSLKDLQYLPAYDIKCFFFNILFPKVDISISPSL